MRRRRRDFIAGLAAGGAASLAASGLAANPADPNSRLFTFVGGREGAWSVVGIKAVVGDPLPSAPRLDIVNGKPVHAPESANWMLRGVVSNERYIRRAEKEVLASKQVSLGRREATHGALIPIRKNAKWWSMTQDERRSVFEEQSHHIAKSLKYLPAIARRLHHCRDVSENEPFDFLTLFDYSKADASAFEDLVAVLRESEEWKFVEREVDIRLVRNRD
jgi:hypothetical protein